MSSWKDHFEELLKNKQKQHSKGHYTTTEKTVNIDKITRQELDEAINELKNGRAPGYDKITT